jgi:hypothetical protein
MKKERLSWKGCRREEEEHGEWKRNGRGRE